MPAQPALAARAEPATAESATAESDDGGMPNPQLYPVPTHEPTTDWPGPRPGADAVGSPRAQRAERADGGQDWPRQFAVLLTEALAGVRPVRQLQPWLSDRGGVHLRRLLPLFAGGHRPRITRVLTTQPSRDVVEMTLIITVGPRTRALAVRLEQTHPAQRPAGHEKLAPPLARTRPVAAARWRCTDIESA